MTTSETPVAVVLSGGGAYGAFEVGVLKALCGGQSPSTGHRPLEPQIYCGTSAGSFNASFMVSKWEQEGAVAAEQLEVVWLEKLAKKADGSNGFYRIRGNPLEYLDPRSYLRAPLQTLRQMAEDGAYLSWNALNRALHVATDLDQPLEQRVIELLSISTFVSREPWVKTLQEAIDYDSIRRSPVALRVAATNWVPGELRVFKNRDMTASRGPQAILSSSALPGFFPPANFGAETFIDGGVLLNTPIRPAIRCGAAEIHAIYLDPDIKRIPTPQVLNSLEVFYRMQQIDWAWAYNDDINDAERINQGLEIIRRAGRGQLSQRDAEKFVQTAAQLAKWLASSRYRPLTIHRYFPRDDLGGVLGLLDVDPQRIVELIEIGFDNAKWHDCGESKCILVGDRPETEPAAASRETGVSD